MSLSAGLWKHLWAKLGPGAERGQLQVFPPVGVVPVLLRVQHSCFCSGPVRSRALQQGGAEPVSRDQAQALWLLGLCLVRHLAQTHASLVLVGIEGKDAQRYQCLSIHALSHGNHSRPLFPPVRSVDSSLTTAVSICEVGAVGATKPERAGIVRLKSEIKQVRAGGASCSCQVLWVTSSYRTGRIDGTAEGSSLLGFRELSCFQKLLWVPVLPWGDNWAKSVSGCGGCSGSAVRGEHRGA